MSLNLDITGKGTPAGNLNNAVQVLEHDPIKAGTIYYDVFLRRVMTGSPAHEWTDADDIALLLYMQREVGILRIGLPTVSQAVIAVAFENKKNCVRDWMALLKWDGVDRVEHFFEDHFGAAGTAYTRSASRNFWLSIVARVFRPGCKADNMIVFEGPQGIGKSRALQTIGGDYYAEQHESPSNPKAFSEILQGKLIIEIGEMDAFSRAEVSRVKQAITCTSDRFRAAYGRHAEDHPRSCIFVGTTNRDDWNKDETGARRFWPIACHGEIDVPGIKANRDQLFAEAVHRFNAGETWWEMPSEETRAEQLKRYDADVWTEDIATFIETKGKVTANEILTDCLKFESSRIGRTDQMRVATALRSLGWKKRDTRVGNKVLKVWKPADEE